MATSFSGSTAFEFVHNQVHYAIGGFNPSSPGHMATFSYLVFDPIVFVPPPLPPFPSHPNFAIGNWCLILGQLPSPRQHRPPHRPLTSHEPRLLHEPRHRAEGSYTVAIVENITVDTPLAPVLHRRWEDGLDEWEGEVYWGFWVWVSGIGRC
jgi:tyrosinase